MKKPRELEAEALELGAEHLLAGGRELVVVGRRRSSAGIFASAIASESRDRMARAELAGDLLGRGQPLGPDQRSRRTAWASAIFIA